MAAVLGYVLVQALDESMPVLVVPMPVPVGLAQGQEWLPQAICPPWHPPGALPPRSFISTQPAREPHKSPLQKSVTQVGPGRLHWAYC